MSTGLDLFEQREQPPMSAEMFTTLVVGRLRSGGVEVKGQRRLEVTFQNGGGRAVAKLDVQYLRYREEPSALTPLIQEFIDGLEKDLTKSPPAEAFDLAPPNLMPLLVGLTDWERKLKAGVRMVTRPLVGDLGVALVIDEPEAVTFPGYDKLGDWNLNVADAFEMAVGNLERNSRGIRYSQTGEGEKTLLVDNVTDGYAATRAILPSRLADWSGRVPGELVLGIPSRGFLIGMSSRHPNLDAIAGQVEKDAVADEHGISRRLLVYRGGKLAILPLGTMSGITGLE